MSIAQDRVLSALRSVQWDGEAPGSPLIQRKAEAVLKRIVVNLWDEGLLPLRISNKQWLAGFTCNLSFHMSTIQSILVGPAQPSHYRNGYAVIHTS